jgi:NADH-quinone oxidoreductase subunit N
MLPVKIAVLALVIQLLAVALQPAIAIWQPLLAFASAGSLAWGCFGALAEKKTKRFLAYASINQMGFLLMGVTCGTFEGYRVTLFYLVLYALMTVGFLIVFFNTRHISTGQPISHLTDFRGLSRVNRRYS